LKKRINYFNLFFNIAGDGICLARMNEAAAMRAADSTSSLPTRPKNIDFDVFYNCFFLKFLIQLNSFEFSMLI